MTEEEKNKLVTNNQLLKSDNRILAEQIKKKDKDISLVRKELQKKQAKINRIYRITSSDKVTKENYYKAMEYINKIIKEEI